MALKQSYDLENHCFTLTIKEYGSVIMSRDNPGRVVPLFRDKKSLHVLLSLCLGTRAAAKITGQTSLSRDQKKKSKYFKKKFF